MTLTGKAKEDYENWLSKEDNIFVEEIKEMSNYIDKRYLNTLIIEWFDSVGIYIGVNVMYAEEYFTYEINIQGYHFVDNEEIKTRPEATEQAIIKANEIYNEK